MIASMTKYKDYDLFLDVAKYTYNVNKEITFVAVGDGDEFNHIQHRCNEENIKHTILLVKRDEVENLIYASDIGMLCSPSEGISNAIIEYMALGKPVISTDTNGGSKEIIEEGKSGYVAKRDAGVITSLILKLVEDESLRNKLGERGKEIITSKFTIERMGQEYLNLYEKIYGKKSFRCK